MLLFILWGWEFATIEYRLKYILTYFEGIFQKKKIKEIFEQWLHYEKFGYFKDITSGNLFKRKIDTSESYAEAITSVNP